MARRSSGVVRAMSSRSNRSLSLRLALRMTRWIPTGVRMPEAGDDVHSPVGLSGALQRIPKQRGRHQPSPGPPGTWGCVFRDQNRRARTMSSPRPAAMHRLSTAVLFVGFVQEAWGPVC